MQRYDLVLENGKHKLSVPLEGEPTHFQGMPVVHALRLTPLYRTPYLGVILRNVWAKSRGARLYP